jgi:hypothetical protein
LTAIVPTAWGQEERPEIPVGERKVPRKKDAGPRAIGVLRMTDKGKASLVPIAILINGKFWDATAYKADPVPMALESGTVYEAEHSGSSLGLFTVGSALHSNSRNTEAPWIGTGVWKPTGTDVAKPALQKANITPVGIDSDDAPPRLTHDPVKAAPVSTSPASTTAPASSAPSATAPPATSSKPGGSSDDDERPHLNRPSSSSSEPPAGSTQAGQPAPGGQPQAKSPQANPKPDEGKAEAKVNVPASDSGADEANRPILRHGKPAESFADEDVPGYSKTGVSGGTSSESTGKIVEAKAAQADVKLIPAISDAKGPIPHPYTFEWIKGEEEDRRKQMIALAKQQVQNYVIARDRLKITPTHPQPSKRAAIKVKEPVLDNVQMMAYDLWGSNQPIIVLSAQAHLPPPPPGAPHSDTASDLQYPVMLVAYPDIYNNLHTLYSGVTDKFHLDLTPQLELIDAVDADGDGRGELLFRETTDMGTGWVIYRATGDKLYKMFDSLSPE